ncbi:NAD(P)-binding protein [Zopfia rhizophila CBS 207.26]|uniref:NAD(P)-binding protein n=1 Tax=Zopfia rhizophila CBS 207.26 TaxID=1314779 RepID=A0A6A6D9D8_9PEZI|nr:NAD(P)-binding protein [Zopfia rhizophila CBS 207.26]
MWHGSGGTRLSSKSFTIFLTGGARCTCRGITRHFLTAGHRVFVLDANIIELTNTSAIAETQWGTTPANFGCRRIQRPGVMGKLDMLINNVIRVPHIWGEGNWDEKGAVGLTALFLLLCLCVAPLKANPDDSSSRPGCIINIPSTRATQAELNHEAHSTVEAGILGLTQSMAISLGHRHKIHVENELEATKEKKWEEVLAKEDMEWHSARRADKMEDIFVTGQEIMVGGGVSRKIVYPE